MAEIGTTPVAVDGADRLTVGGVRSFNTVTVTTTEVELDELEVARADTVWVPLVVVLVSQLYEQGLLAHEATTLLSMEIEMLVEPRAVSTLAVTVTVPVAGDGPTPSVRETSRPLAEF